MKKLVLLAAALAVGMAGTAPPQPAEGVRFEAVDVFVDSGKTPLAAYQLEVKASLDGGRVRLVGVEGGDYGAFQEPPYYDPEALKGERIILAAYSLLGDEKLPTGRTRVARLQVQLPERASARYTCELTVAGNSMAEAIEAKAESRRFEATIGPVPAAPSPR